MKVIRYIGWPLLLLHFFVPVFWREQVLALQTVVCAVTQSAVVPCRDGRHFVCAFVGTGHRRMDAPGSAPPGPDQCGPVGVQDAGVPHCPVGGRRLVSAVVGHGRPVLESGTGRAAMPGLFICHKLSAAMVVRH